MMITVTLPDHTKREFPIKEKEEVRYKEIAEKVQNQYPDDIILAMVGGKLMELNRKIKESAEVSFFTTGTTDGKRAYRRSMVMLLQCAVSHLYGEDTKLRILCSLGDGYYCELFGRNQKCCQSQSCGMKSQESVRMILDVSDLERIRTTMDAMIEQNHTISKHNVSTRKAEAMFGEKGYKDKERLFHYRRSSRTNLYELNGYFDYFYGFMAPSTGMLKYYDLGLYEDGFIFQLPGKNSRKTEEIQPSGKLFRTMQESRTWSRKLGIGTIGTLNDAITQGRGQDMILLSEALMEARIGELASKIAADPQKKFIMIAGPSSSGKTSFANRLTIQLTAHGKIPHPISLDDYYVNRVDTPKNPDGSYNFECLEALDIQSFNSNMLDLLEGKRVELPTYNFKTGMREYRGNSIQLGPEDILVIEGIHGLNDRLSYSLPSESKFKIYISALTQLNIDEHNPLSTADGRLIRRMVRDSRTRGTSAKETIRMWPSVRAGEEQNIFPFQESADVMFNSALVYELAVLKVYAEPLLFQVQPGDPEYLEAQRLLKFLDYLLPLPAEGINQNSLMREFVGGSCFNV